MDNTALLTDILKDMHTAEENQILGNNRQVRVNLLKAITDLSKYINQLKFTQAPSHSVKDVEGLEHFAKWFNTAQWQGGKGDYQKGLFVKQDFNAIVKEYLKAAQFSPIEETKSDNSFLVHNNSDAFRKFLDLSKVKWEAAEHSTKIVQGGINVNQFFLGGAWREYNLKNNPKYIEDKTQAVKETAEQILSRHSKHNGAIEGNPRAIVQASEAIEAMEEYANQFKSSLTN